MTAEILVIVAGPTYETETMGVMLDREEAVTKCEALNVVGNLFNVRINEYPAGFILDSNIYAGIPDGFGLEYSTMDEYHKAVEDVAARKNARATSEKMIADKKFVEPITKAFELQRKLAAEAERNAFDGLAEVSKFIESVPGKVSREIKNQVKAVRRELVNIFDEYRNETHDDEAGAIRAALERRDNNDGSHKVSEIADEVLAEGAFNQMVKSFLLEIKLLNVREKQELIQIEVMSEAFPNVLGSAISLDAARLNIAREYATRRENLEYRRRHAQKSAQDLLISQARMMKNL